jgi:MOSC domain-containing protein YiiM
VHGTLESLNVGLPEPIGEHRGRPVLSGFRKSPVAGRLRTAGDNLTGDDQADRSVHGGPEKAIYAYASEDLAWWAQGFGRPMEPGRAFGENLTTSGIDCTGAVIGERWRVGSTLLEVCQPRLPCFKLGLVHGDPRMLRHFAGASRPGAYLRILEHGEVGAGDAIEVHDRPDHGVTVSLVADALLLDRSLLPRVLEAPQLAGTLRAQLTGR